MSSHNSSFVKTSCLTLAASLAFVSTVDGQRARFGDSFVIPNGQVAPAMPVQGTASNNPALLQLPPPVLPQLPGTVQTNPPVVVQQQTFDPFAIQTPIITAPQGTQSIQPPPYIYPPPTAPPGNVVPPGYTYPYPPPYTNGSWAESAIAWPSQAWARLRSSEIYRLLERPRFRHTYLAGSGPAGNLGLNEIDLATTLTIPNFLFTNQPLRFSPGFVFYWWDGPNTMLTGADLPPRTYSTYFAFDYSTPWDRPIGGEINFTVGVYSDFSTVNSNSVRYTGVGLGWLRISNTTTFKFGIEYLDRVRVKILPAVGFFIHPNPDVKFDVYFPRPKLAHRLPSLGNYEVWGYVGGEYGAGSWTVERLAMFTDQADVNDIRAFLGVEWMGPKRVTGFFEVGYVFDREIRYRSAPGIPFKFSDTVMLRSGIAF